MKNKKRFINNPFSISIEQAPNGFSMPEAHIHNDYEIYILISGRRTVLIDEKTYVTSPGDAVFFPPNVAHRSTGTVCYEGICIHFSESYLKKYYTKEALHILLECFSESVISLNSEQLLKMHDYAINFDKDNLHNFLVLGNILQTFCTNIEKNYPPDYINPADKTNSLTCKEKIMCYINENYTTISSVSDIASQFGVTEGYVYKTVKSATQNTPKEYINNLRMSAATRYLSVDSSCTIKKISEYCGYSSYEYFCRVFKSKYGVSPTEYRKLAEPCQSR